MSTDEVTELAELARLYGVQTEFLDTAGTLRRAAPETLLGVLKAMGAPVDRVAEIGEAVRARRDERASRWLEPVAVVWEPAPPSVPLRLTGASAGARLDCRLTSEGGESREWSASAGELELEPSGDGSGGLRLAMPAPMATGYHRLTVALGRETRECLVIVAPVRAYEAPDTRAWGVFCPLYGLHRESSWGAGDYSDLSALIDWTADRGGRLVATLPMLATAFDDRPISPYSPASRLFWNAFYLDVNAVPGLSRCHEARALMESPEFRREVGALREAPLVDYRRQMGLKRRVLEPLAESALGDGADPPRDFTRFRRDYPEAESYARFMAQSDRHGPVWEGWPADPDENLAPAVRYHLYAQWQSDAQLHALATRAESRGLTWYVDYTVGVDPLSYDVWSRPGLFAKGATVGCPPDEGFTSGQNWKFPPVIPDRQRDEGYAYFIASLRNHLRYANALRLDHVMGLHRLYWIPGGGGGNAGAYVTYPAEEIYAILSVESHRRRAWVVGENLGTVPPEVPPAMKRHAVMGMYALQYELTVGTGPVHEAVPAEVVASLNTHDMPTFDAFRDLRDVRERVELGLTNEATAAKESAERPARLHALVALLQDRGFLGADDAADASAVCRACDEFLAASPARVVLLSLGDLWLEPDPQNIPGTKDEVPNWRRKLRLPFEEFTRRPDVLEALRKVDRRRASAPPGPLEWPGPSETASKLPRVSPDRGGLRPTGST